ncbi:MAG TPA: acyl-CoA synthetase FdrA [Casimicrobiaceae bacterium]|jgi:FdrA protein|nr:acyl-CoA synthetase FdrA [Casimicrobiaceae bacterium]
MLHAFLLKGSFQDSVTLMVLSRDLSALPDVSRVSAMMGTPANKDVFRETGLWHDALQAATPNDLCIVVDTADGAVAAGAVDELKRRLAELAKGRRGARYPTARSWRRARTLAPEANLALISIAGHYAFEPAKQALEDGCHVMMFSDNVSVEQEVALKALGRARGLLVMGPDCGTAIVGKAPLAFANRIPPGTIAVVGASGTGIQELTSQIARLGGGITHALGLGGRDLSARVGGISALLALDMVKADPASRVVAFVSKPPAEAVKLRVVAALKALGKPVVALFLGERPARRHDGNVHYALTLDEAAALAVELANVDAQAAGWPDVAGKGICGLYTGGTLAAEAALLLAETLGLAPDATHAEGFMLKSGGHRIVDLGDDVYTRGRPHPMIDPSLRNEMIAGLADDPSFGVLLVDVVLGFGAHKDPAGEVARSVTALRAARNGRAPIVVVATLTGTADDPQDRASQAAKLEEAGIVIAESTRAAVTLAAHVVAPRQPAAGEAPALLAAMPSVINVGLRGFADDLQANGVRVVQLQWEPSAGGDERMQRLVARLQ